MDVFEKYNIDLSYLIDAELELHPNLTMKEARQRVLAYFQKYFLEVYGRDDPSVDITPGDSGQ